MINCQKQQSAYTEKLDGSVLSYEYNHAGFSIDLEKHYVLLFNKNINSSFLYSYCCIREINYSLPANEFEEAEICILTDDALNLSWIFNVPTNAHTQDIFEHLVKIFHDHIFCYSSAIDKTYHENNINI
ncbi:hypothetical protein AVE81_005199 [Salmonella enterica subsp. diarizonae]|nr:hypothetical protein [Salmonella enterica subsp. diarizonae]EDW9104183.1 hypothetical protein [Salmonella enterica subsp. diarizonae]